VNNISIAEAVDAYDQAKSDLLTPLGKAITQHMVRHSFSLEAEENKAQYLTWSGILSPLIE
jgi:hypothetical protein